MLKYPLQLIIAACLIVPAFAQLQDTPVSDDQLALQEVCGTESPSKEETLSAEMEIHDFLTDEGKTIENHALVAGNISVYVHVIRTSGGYGDVPNWRINQQISHLNSAYAGTGFSFSLAGVTRTNNSNWYYMGQGSSAEYQAKSSLRRGGSRTLNVYLGGFNNGLLGWATFPWWYSGNPSQDGVVLLNATLTGGSNTNNTGDILVHEIGHWLGLLHTFEGGCWGQGDYVSDTPAEAEPGRSCYYSRDSCPSQPGYDPLYSYMNYTGDACMSQFTNGQVNRMNVYTNYYR